MYQSLVIDHEEFRDIQLFDIKTEPVEQVLSCLDPAPWFEKNKYVLVSHSASFVGTKIQYALI